MRATTLDSYQSPASSIAVRGNLYELPEAEAHRDFCNMSSGEQMREINTTISSQHANSLSLNSTGNQGANALRQYGSWDFCEVIKQMTNNEWQIWGHKQTIQHCPIFSLVP